jgi:predicted nucleic acid-binding protein
LTRILLDTSAFKRGHREIQHRIQEADQIQLNPVVLGELHAGFSWSVKGMNPEGEFVGDLALR